MQRIYEILAKSKIDKLLNYMMESKTYERKNHLSSVDLSSGSVNRLRLQQHRFA